MSTLTPTEERTYRALRRDGIPASRALQTIRLRNLYAGTLEAFGEWDFTRGDFGAFAQADREVGNLTIRVLVGDDDFPVEWGDCEPTDEERESAHAYYVAVQVLEDGAEVYHDGIGGVDAIDLPQYVTQDWGDAAGYALTEYLLDGALKYATTEPREAAYWAARDVETVGVI